MREHYRILGVPPGTSGEVLKKAYRKQAMKYHPDVNDSPQAKLRFQKINDAYHQLLEKPQVVERKLTPEEMADILEKKFKDQKRERMKARMREIREEEDERMVNSSIYKAAVIVQRAAAYGTVIIAVSMILIPLISFFIEVDSDDFKWKRAIYFAMIMAVGVIFMYGGVYLVKHKRE